MTFGERLSELTKKRGGQAALYKFIGVGSSTVSEWCGDKKEPKLSNVIKIAEYFEMSLDELLAPVLTKADKVTSPPPGMAEERRELLQYFDGLSDVDRKIILAEARVLYIRADVEKKDKQPPASASPGAKAV